MRYKSQIKTFFLVFLVFFIAAFLLGILYPEMLGRCDTFYFSPTSYPAFYHPSCPLVVFLGYASLPLLATLLSLVPFYFLKEQVYKIWRQFAIIAIPIIALLIFFAPAHSLGPFYYFGYDREVASMLFSVLFLLVSWSIAIKGSLKKGK